MKATIVTIGAPGAEVECVDLSDLDERCFACSQALPGEPYDRAMRKGEDFYRFLASKATGGFFDGLAKQFRTREEGRRRGGYSS